MHTSIKLLLLPVVAALVAGCASVSVRETKTPKRQLKATVPAKVYVENFEVVDETFRMDREGESLRDVEWALADKLNRALVRRISAKIAPARSVAPGAPLPKQNAWLVRGRFDRVHQGSRFLRVALGFGLGATKVETTCFVYDLRTPNSPPFLIIQTTGGSNAMPGAVTAVLNPYSLVAAVITGLPGGVSHDINRTSKELTHAMSEYLYLQGVIADDEAHFPKRMGSWP